MSKGLKNPSPSVLNHTFLLHLIMRKDWLHNIFRLWQKQKEGGKLNEWGLEGCYPSPLYYSIGRPAEFTSSYADSQLYYFHVYVDCCKVPLTAEAFYKINLSFLERPRWQPWPISLHWYSWHILLFLLFCRIIANPLEAFRARWRSAAKSINLWWMKFGLERKGKSGIFSFFLPSASFQWENSRNDASEIDLKLVGGWRSAFFSIRYSVFEEFCGSRAIF